MSTTSSTPETTKTIKTMGATMEPDYKSFTDHRAIFNSRRVKFLLAEAERTRKLAYPYAIGYTFKEDSKRREQMNPSAEPELSQAERDAELEEDKARWRAYLSASNDQAASTSASTGKGSDGAG